MKKVLFWTVLLIFIASLFLAIFVFIKFGPHIMKDKDAATDENIFTCSRDEECIPDNPLLGINYVCEDGSCAAKVLANPASINCQEKGGDLDFRKKNNNANFGVCKFADDTECEEWKFLREECFPGDFNPGDNIWEGSVKMARGGKYDKYFEMLNGEELGISSKDSNIISILNALVSKNNNIKVIGNISENSAAYNGKELIVEEILDLGNILFNEIDKDESLQIAAKKIEESENFINNKGKNLELFEAAKVDCPYCWNFIFTYLDNNRKAIFLDVIIQEGEVKDVAEIENNIYKNCDEFALAQVCTEQYEPVCGRVELESINNTTNEVTEEIEWGTFSNSCKACILKDYGKKVNWYKDGECR